MLDVTGFWAWNVEITLESHGAATGSNTMTKTVLAGQEAQDLQEFLGQPLPCPHPPPTSFTKFLQKSDV